MVSKGGVKRNRRGKGGTKDRGIRIEVENRDGGKK